MNNEVWPDFTKINRPNGKKVFELNALDEAKENRIDDFRSGWPACAIPCRRWASSSHRDGSSSAYSADTGSTEEFGTWSAMLPNLRGLVVEISFPNALQKLADITGHLTPGDLVKELKKIRRPLNIPIIVFGVKPEYEKEIRKEIKDLNISGLEFPKTGKVYNL